jgi:hypothetical protein
MLTKREGLLLAACVVVAGFAASWRERRSAWPRLAVSALAALALALPWRVWFTSHGIPGDGPSEGYLGALHHLDRGWPTVQLVVTTLFDPDFWLLAPTVAIAAAVLAGVARAWTIAVYAGAFTIAAMVAGIWIIWSEASLPITQDDARNPVVRLTGTSILVLVALTPAMLDRAWSVGRTRGPTRSGNLGPDAFVWRSTSAWLVVLAAVLVHPASILTNYSGQGLPGGPPTFPAASDCVAAPAPGGDVRLVLGYARSYQEAGSLRTLAARAGIRKTRVAQDGCGRLRVSAHRVPAPALLDDVLARARSEGLEPTLERDTGG